MRPACVEPVHRHSWSAAGRVPWPSRLIELSAVVQANPQSNTNDGDVPLRHTTVLAAGAPLHLDGRAGRVLRPIRGPYQSGRQRIPMLNMRGAETVVGNVPAMTCWLKRFCTPANAVRPAPTSREASTSRVA